MLSSKDYVMVTAGSLAVTALGLVVPKMNEVVLEQIVPYGEKGIPKLIEFAILFIVAGLIKSAISGIRGVYLGRTRERIACKTQAAVMARLLLLPHSYFIKYTTGALSKQISNARRLCDQIIGFILDSSLTALFSVAYIFQMGGFTKVMVLPALVVILVKMVLSVIIAFYEADNRRDSLEAETESESFLYTAIKGVQTIKSSGAERRLYVNWAKRYSKVLKYDLDKPTLLKLEDVLINLVSSVGTVILISLVIPYKIAVTDYMAFVNAYGLVATACTGLMDSFSKLVLMRPMADTFSDLMKESIECVGTKTYLRNVKGNIKIENVSFSYEGSNRSCLKDISINIKPKEKIALVGESGCGKSTLLKLMMGSLQPDSGGIYIDGNDLANINLRSYRKHVGSVFQFSNLMPGTIYSNIAFCPVPVSRQDAQEALKKAAIDEYIDSLPMGMDTEISDSGFRGFSGGQRQRILLARAFASHPSILMLDEATSALDNVTQARVLDAVYRESCTVVIVAHRLSTVKDCDRIIMLGDGRIIEEGTYTQLMEKNGAFAELVRKQQEAPLNP
jgi:ABC-type bacteriocin/lantibiotic exporter with double-glycine peptidase domain